MATSTDRGNVRQAKRKYPNQKKAGDRSKEKSRARTLTLHKASVNARIRTVPEEINLLEKEMTEHLRVLCRCLAENINIMSLVGGTYRDRHGNAANWSNRTDRADEPATDPETALPPDTLDIHVAMLDIMIRSYKAIEEANCGVPKAHRRTRTKKNDQGSKYRQMLKATSVVADKVLAAVRKLPNRLNQIKGQRLEETRLLSDVTMHDRRSSAFAKSLLIRDAFDDDGVDEPPPKRKRKQ
jgi:hypothetical protein